MPDNLLPSTSTNRRKWIFVVVVLGVLVVLFTIFTTLFRSGTGVGGRGFNPEFKEVSFWTVGIDPKVFSELQNAFNSYIGRSDVKLTLRNFYAYDDYRLSLIHTIAQGQSPDVVMAYNHGGHHEWDQYTSALGGSLVDFIDFENRFHKLFVNELVFEEKQTVDGQTKIVQGLRGVPIGFESLGVFYNRDLVSAAPTTWETLTKIVKLPAKRRLTPSDADNTAPSISATSLGYGRATPASPDILALLQAQKKSQTEANYKMFGTIEAKSLIEDYLAYRRSPNNLGQFQADFDVTLTAVDLFVRGKIATLIGYPSTLYEIELAIDRAKNDNALASGFEDNMRFTKILQSQGAKVPLNLASYTYFLMAKDGIHRGKIPKNDPVLRVMSFLLTKEAQAILSRSMPYMLPSQITTLADPTLKINPESNISITLDHWYDPLQEFVTYDMGIPYEFRSRFREALDEPGATGTTVGANVANFITCRTKRLADPGYTNSCSCVIDLQSNGNNYWPVCGGW